MKKLFLLIFILLAVSAFAQLPCTPAPCDTGQLSTTFNSLTRYYKVYVPSGLTVHPPMFIFLGPSVAGTSYNTAPMNSGWTPMKAFANANHVLVVYIAPTCRDYSGSPPPTIVCSSGTPAGFLQWYFEINYFDSFMSPAPDDSGYINSIISTAVSTWGVDSTKVGLIGFSTGAFMVHRVALEHAASISLGVAEFAGEIWAQQASTCSGTPPNITCPTTPANSSPMNVYLANSDNDSVIFPEGGTNGGAWPGQPSMDFPSVDTSYNYWVTSMCGLGVTTTSAGTSSSVIATKLSGIVGNGTTATGTCTSTCGLNPTGTYDIRNSGAFSGTNIVVGTSSGTTFTFPSSVNGSSSGGYVMLTFKQSTGCTSSRQLRWVNRGSVGHVSPTATEISTAWAWLTGSAVVTPGQTILTGTTTGGIQ